MTTETNIQANNYNKSVNQPNSKGLRANTAKRYPLKQRTLPDTVEIGGKKKTDTSAGAKFGMGLSLIGSIALAALLLTKKGGKSINNIKEAEKVYNAFLTRTKLPEHINFKEAGSVEEGIEWAKKNFGIKEIDETFSLEAINDTNRNLVELCNKHKGDLYLPKALRYRDLSEKVSGKFISDTKTGDFGTVYINSKYYDEKWLDESLRKELYKEDKVSQIFSFDKNNELTDIVTKNYIAINPSEGLASLISKYYKTPEKLTLNNKRELIISIQRANDNVEFLTNRSPLSLLEKIKNLDYVKRSNININLAYWKKQPLEKILEFTNGILKQIQNPNDIIIIDAIRTPAAQPFFHDMESLQKLGKMWQEASSKPNIVRHSGIKIPEMVKNPAC